MLVRFRGPLESARFVTGYNKLGTCVFGTTLRPRGSISLGPRETLTIEMPESDASQIVRVLLTDARHRILRRWLRQKRTAPESDLAARSRSNDGA